MVADADLRRLVASAHYTEYIDPLTRLSEKIIAYLRRNIAVYAVSSIINSEIDSTPPSVFLPQRNPYNHGAEEYTELQSADMMSTTMPDSDVLN